MKHQNQFANNKTEGAPPEEKNKFQPDARNVALGLESDGDGVVGVWRSLGNDATPKTKGKKGKPHNENY